MERYAWLKKFPIVHFNEIQRRTASNAYAKLVVYRLIKAGKITRVTKGIYSASEDAFSVASNLYFPSYLSGLSASYFYGFTEAIPLTLTILVHNKHKKIEYKKYFMEFVSSNQLWGYHKEGKGNEIVFIADLEKLIIDAFLYPKQMGNFEEIENIFKKIEEIDVEKLKKYLKKLNSNKIYRQVGYMVEKYKNIDLSLIMPINRTYYFLNPFEKNKKKLNKKWRLFI